jgi:hypothetical protein
MELVNRAKRALWAKSGLAIDKKGYVEEADIASNFVPGVTPDMIKEDFDKGSGQEWMSKIRAVHSSSALAANVFGRWKSEPSRLTFAGSAGFAPPKLEAQCPTGLWGTPPNIDVLLESCDTVIGIESKLLEPLTPTVPKISGSYTRARLPLCEDAWWSLLEQVRKWPASHLDAAQLIKHYLGLRKQFPNGKKVLLVYLFWKPLNAAQFDEYTRHAEDLKKFACSVESAEGVRFMSMDYLQLWNEWENDKNMAEHARILKKRYCVEI